MSERHYVGRFAPSPTGPLHFGSLVAAVGSCLQARARGGHWLVRMEDIDPPREVPGADDDILRSLETHGFEWDGEVARQSTRGEAYSEAIERLRTAGRLFACSCSRAQIAQSARSGPAGRIYPGTCRERPADPDRPLALRARIEERTVGIEDAVQGAYRMDLADIGDFVVRRADGLFAYHLAVTVDDAWQGVTEVVRGADLLGSVPHQAFLQDLLDLPRPAYVHLPIATNAAGEKLSKQTGARALAGDPAANLRRALIFLGQEVPAEGLMLKELWRHAVAHWDLSRVPGRPAPAREG